MPPTMAPSISSRVQSEPANTQTCIVTPSAALAARSPSHSRNHIVVARCQRTATRIGGAVLERSASARGQPAQLAARQGSKHAARCGATSTSDAPAASSAGSAPAAVSFTPSGLLFPYFVGAAQALDDAGYFTAETRFAGASGGAIISAFICCGVQYETIMAGMQEVGEDCRANGTVWRLAEVVEAMLHKYLPADCHERCSGRLTVALSRREGAAGALAVDHFTSKADLVDALVATSAIPYFSVPARGVPFRGVPCASDGGEKAFCPLPNGWDAAALGRPFTICPFHVQRLGFAGIAREDVDISPDVSEPDKSLKEFLEYALQGLVIQSPTQLDSLRDAGYTDAQMFLAGNP